MADICRIIWRWFGEPLVGGQSHSFFDPVPTFFLNRCLFHSLGLCVGVRSIDGLWVSECLSGTTSLQMASACSPYSGGMPFSGTSSV